MDIQERIPPTIPDIVWQTPQRFLSIQNSWGTQGCLCMAFLGLLMRNYTGCRKVQTHTTTHTWMLWAYNYYSDTHGWMLCEMTCIAFGVMSSDYTSEFKDVKGTYPNIPKTQNSNKWIHCWLQVRTCSMNFEAYMKTRANMLHSQNWTNTYSYTSHIRHKMINTKWPWLEIIDPKPKLMIGIFNMTNSVSMCWCPTFVGTPWCFAMSSADITQTILKKKQWSLDTPLKSSETTKKITSYCRYTWCNVKCIYIYIYVCMLNIVLSSKAIQKKHLFRSYWDVFNQKRNVFLPRHSSRAWRASIPGQGRSTDYIRDKVIPPLMMGILINGI